MFYALFAGRPAGDYSARVAPGHNIQRDEMIWLAMECVVMTRARKENVLCNNCDSGTVQLYLGVFVCKHTRNTGKTRLPLTLKHTHKHTDTYTRATWYFILSIRNSKFYNGKNYDQNISSYFQPKIFLKNNNQPINVHKSVQIVQIVANQ